MLTALNLGPQDRVRAVYAVSLSVRSCCSIRFPGLQEILILPEGCMATLFSTSGAFLSHMHGLLIQQCFTTLAMYDTDLSINLAIELQRMGACADPA